MVKLKYRRNRKKLTARFLNFLPGFLGEDFVADFGVKLRFSSVNFSTACATSPIASNSSSKGSRARGDRLDVKLAARGDLL